MLPRYIMLLFSVIAAATAHIRSATGQRLIVTSYSGAVSSIDLHDKPRGMELETTSISRECGMQPSWLTFDAKHRWLFCIDEGSSQGAGVAAMRVGYDGNLILRVNSSVPLAPVNGELFWRKENKLNLLLAHYSPGAVSSIEFTMGEDSLRPPENPTSIHTIKFPNKGSQVVADRQEGSNAHQVLLDPTENFVLVPDLGADLIRVLSINKRGYLDQISVLSVPGGTGPRHGAFWRPKSTSLPSEGNPLFYMVVGELSGTVLVYRVDYLVDDKGLLFHLVETLDTLLRSDAYVPYYPAEIAVSPDNGFVIISNRGDKSAATKVPGVEQPVRSDTLSNFKINYDSSKKEVKLEMIQLFSVGGSNPRHFAFNKDGSLVAVPLQDDGAVSVISRDTKTGLLRKLLIRYGVAEKPTYVLWDEYDM